MFNVWFTCIVPLILSIIISCEKIIESEYIRVTFTFINVIFSDIISLLQLTDYFWELFTPDTADCRSSFRSFSSSSLFVDQHKCKLFSPIWWCRLVYPRFWPCLPSLFLLSLPTTLQLQLHANESPVLQRRKGGKPNWIECNSVHKAGNESIMLRNGFRKALSAHLV